MSATETKLTEILARLLEVDPTSLKPDQTFDQQGIDSLVALRLLREITDTFGVLLELDMLYDHPSIRSLADYLDRESANHP